MTYSRMTYLTDGIRTAFPFAFKVDTAADLRVFLVDLVDSEQVHLHLDSDYTVSGVGEARGGDVELTASGLKKASACQTLVIKSGPAAECSGGGSTIISGSDGNLTEAEEIVGIDYFDGNRPIYQKTVDCGPMPDNTLKRIPHTVGGIRRFWIERGWACRSDSGNEYCYPLPLPNPSVHTVVTAMDMTDVIIQTFYSGMWTNYKESFMTIRYTKEND